MAKKRKVKIGRLILVIVLFVIVILLAVFAISLIRNAIKKDEYVFEKENLNINEIDYSEMKELNLDLYSESYLLVRLNDFKVLYGKNINDRIYPASLTKIVTLDTVVSNVKDLNDASSYNEEDYVELIEANASLAGLAINREYSINDLLYALVLPSGADAGRALENYFESKGMDLITEMNNLCKRLELRNSHFTNSAGLHDDELYTSLDDYMKIIIDTLLKDNAKAVLKTFEKELADGSIMKSTLAGLNNRDDGTIIYGGKTGFTGQAGENIMVLFSKDDRSYLLILANAPGNPYEGQLYHMSDVNSILDSMN